MPMSFPTMQSLINRAKVRNFREPLENESEDVYRKEFADFMRSVDLVESMEIRSGLGWDKQNPTDFLEGAFGKTKLTEMMQSLTAEEDSYGKDLIAEALEQMPFTGYHEFEFDAERTNLELLREELAKRSNDLLFNLNNYSTLSLIDIRLYSRLKEFFLRHYFAEQELMERGFDDIPRIGDLVQLKNGTRLFVFGYTLNEKIQLTFEDPKNYVDLKHFSNSLKFSNKRITEEVNNVSIIKHYEN